MTGRWIQRYNARLATMARAYGWIAWKRLRGRIGRARTLQTAPMAMAAGAADLGDPAMTRLVVVGDSLAAGIGDAVPGLRLVGWADRLAMALGRHCPQVRCANLAAGGLTTAQVAGRQLAGVRALAPDLIILCAGGNDLLSRRWDPAAFRRDYAALLAALLGTGATVITTTWHDVPRAVAMPAALAERFSRRLAEAGEVVREVSAAHGAVCVDFWRMPMLLDSQCYSADGIHPNALGYLRVAGMLAGSVAEVLGIALPPGAILHQAGYHGRRAAGAARSFPWAAASASMVCGGMIA